MEDTANEKLRQMAELPLEVTDVDMPSAKLAATLKARFGLPYVDCFAASLASLRKATIVTTDSDFKALGQGFDLLTL